MDNDVTWWKQNRNNAGRNQNGPAAKTETPGDTQAPDIVGRTGEEMPEVAHDEPDETPEHDVRPPEDDTNS
jgi:hypothetical protein